MKEILKSIEGQMDESEFYGSLIWAVARGTGLILLLLAIGYVINTFLIPAASGGSAGLYLISWVVTFAAFVYVFKPGEWLGWGGRIMFGIYTAGYAFAMHVGGETIFIAALILGVIIAIVIVFGDATFSGMFLYRDLKKWVKNKQYREEQAKLAERNVKGEFSQ